MALERTLSILKPDATARNLTVAINAKIEEAGLRIIAQKRIWLSEGQAEGFYSVHRERPFFGGLTDFMSSGPCVLLALEAPDAIKTWRALMGATDPAKAEAATLRKDFGSSIERVSVRVKDVNGPRGGVDQLCRIKVVMRGRPSVIFESRDSSLNAAVDVALAGVQRAVRRTTARRRTKPLRSI